MRSVVVAAAQVVLGGPIPKAIKVEIDNSQRRIILLGPPASGKTRIARAIPRANRKGWRCYSGWTAHDLSREW